MGAVLNSPFVVFFLSLIAQWLAAYLGDLLRNKKQQLREDERADFDTVQTAALTLLALIISFSFAMAVTRYDQRKNYEEAEANAIGTEYLRLGLLPAADTEPARALLRKYLDLRILFYETSRESELAQISADTVSLQADLWAAVLHAANAQPTPAVALVASGMNDVLNAQGYVQAAWWNRIPVAAWAMMGLIAISCNVMLGYGERRRASLLLLVLPIIVSISLFLIADIDSPRGGVIRVLPQNLIALSPSLKAN